MKVHLVGFVGLLAGWLCTVQTGCAFKRKLHASIGVSSDGAVWSQEDAVAVLKRAAVSDDVTIRALALSALIRSSTEGGWLERGWFDPSPSVQRSVARNHAHRLSREHLFRPSADRLAVALALVERREEVTSWAPIPAHFETDELLAVLLGNPTVLLADVRDGMIPPEPLFVEVLRRSGIDGLGDVLAEGAGQAEQDMQLPLALTAFQLLPDKGEQALVEVLRDTDDLTKIFAVEALASLGDDQAAGWLRRVAKTDDAALRDHARMGLVALGLVPVDVAVQGLSFPDRDQRAWAATCLKLAAQNRPLPREAIAALQVAWRDESIMVRQAVTQALIEGAGVEFVPLGPLSSNTVLDAVAVMVAAKWFLVHQKSAPS